MTVFEHVLPVRIYYEDTDFSGRVYHAGYLRFFERGRTEWLRELHSRHGLPIESESRSFAVTRLEVEFHRGAIIDDLLEIHTRLHILRGPLLEFRQSARKNGRPLVEASVNVVTLNGDRAARPPRPYYPRCEPPLRHQLFS